MKKIGIVTVLYNSENVLSDFFSSLASQTYKSFVLIVVYNKCADNSLEVAKRLSEGVNYEIIIIENHQNYGVAKGNNIGITKAIEINCDYILLSNNDITLPDNTIEILYHKMVEGNYKLAVPKIYFHGTNLLWMAGGKFSLFSGSTRQIGFREEDKGQYNQTKIITYAPTCFMLIDRSVFNTVGLMHEEYFVYYDDTDFIFRSNKLNYNLAFIPEAVVYHKVSTSTGIDSDFSIYYMFRNFIYFSLRNYNFIYVLYVLIANFSVHLFKRSFLYPYKKWKLINSAYFDGVMMYFMPRKFKSKY